MDKKSDRKFYWEVKDFMNKPHAPQAPKHTPKVVDSVKSIIEQNKPFKVNSFSTNSTSINNVRQAISNIEQNSKNSTPECKAFTKNLVDHPFRSLNENTTTKPSTGLVYRGPSVVNVPPQIPPKGPNLLGGTVVKNTLPQLARTIISKTPWGRIGLGLLGLGTMAAGAYLSTRDYSEKPDFVKDEEEKTETKPETKPEKTDISAPKELSLDDMIVNMRRAHQTPVPIYKPARRDLGAGVNTSSNYPEWKKATEAKNAALRAANEPLRTEQEKSRAAIRAKVDELQALRQANPNDPRIAQLEKEKGELMQTGRKIYTELNPREGALERGLDTMRGIRQTRWAEKLGQFKQTMQGVDFDSTNPQHQNIMRAQQFPSLYGGQANTAIESAKTVLAAQGQLPNQETETRQRESLANVPTAELSSDTPDWVTRWAKKWGDDPRKIEAMRRGVVNTLGGDPTKPMNTSLSAAAVGARGVK